VVAASFARIYFRNAINLGLAVLQCEAASDALKTGDEVEIDFSGGKILSGGRAFKFFPLPESVIGIIEAGGLLEYTKKKLGKK
jgi:3-isopropylmalate/(R)-2-methylmalate dehydratase small subunit